MVKQFIVLCIIASFTITLAQREESDSDFQAFLEKIMADVLMQVKIRGVNPNNKQRAMIFGYALKRQASWLGDFEADKARLNRLKEDVKAFLSEISPDADLWPITEEAFRGQHDDEVLRLCGGLFKWSPLFRSVGEKDPGGGTGKQGDFQSYPQRTTILSLTDKLFKHWLAREYGPMKAMFSGRLLQEFTNVMAQMESDPETKAEFDQIAANLEWRFISGSVLGDNPPQVSLKYQIKEIDDWYDYEIVFLLEAGTWKIIKLDR